MIGLDPQTNSVWLAYASPEEVTSWEKVPFRFPLNSRHRGEVVVVFSIAVGVNLGGGIVAWLSLAEIRRCSKVDHAQEKFSEGDCVEITVQSVDLLRREIFVGLVD